MSAYTAPITLPVEYVQPGWQVEVHRDATGPLYAAVVNVLKCEDADHDDLCATAIAYPATEVHYSALAELTVRIPCEPEPAKPAGPADDDRVWISTPRRGTDMHALAPGSSQATGCGRSRAAGGITVLASEAVRAWECPPCPRCWPGAS
jgi:hypothetical protein